MLPLPLLAALLLLFTPQDPVTRMSIESTRVPSPSTPPHRRRSARIVAREKSATSIEGSAHGGRGQPSEQRSRLSDKPTSRAIVTPLAKNRACAADMTPLISLGRLVRGTLVKRPSAAVRSPYVADVSLLTEGGGIPSGDTFLAHAPALDVGGMCVPGSEVYLSKRDGEGKTSHSIQLVRGASLAAATTGVLVGAHPRLGELIAEEVLRRGLLRRALVLEDGFELHAVNDIHDSPKKSQNKKRKLGEGESCSFDWSKWANTTTTVSGGSTRTNVSLRRQVTLGDSRVDFQVTLGRRDGASHRVIFEVKNVVCADYEAGTEPAKTGPGHCVVVSPPRPSAIAKADEKEDGGESEKYERTALFPWGRTRGQKFEGHPVVSERACKHLRNLQSLCSDDGGFTPVVLFVVNRSDCESIRACREKCPVFADVLREVVEAGVNVLAVRVRWTENGECFFDGTIPVMV